MGSESTAPYVFKEILFERCLEHGSFFFRGQPLSEFKKKRATFEMTLFDLGGLSTIIPFFLAKVEVKFRFHFGGSFISVFFCGDLLLMEEIRLTTWDVKNPVNTGINHQPQLVSRISEPSTVCSKIWGPRLHQNFREHQDVLVSR